MEQKYLHLRAVDAHEAKFVKKFLDSNRHHFNVSRGIDVYINAAIRRSLFIIEDQSGQIVAVTAAMTKTYEDYPFVEIGSTYVVKDWQGYGLQELFNRTIILLHAMFLDGDNFLLHFSITAPDNTASIHVIKKVGFIEKSIPNALASKKAGKRYFEYDPEKLPESATYMLEIIERGYLETKRGKIPIRFDTLAFGKPFGQELLQGLATTSQQYRCDPSESRQESAIDEEP